MSPAGRATSPAWVSIITSELSSIKCEELPAADDGRTPCSMLNAVCSSGIVLSFPRGGTPALRARSQPASLQALPALLKVRGDVDRAVHLAPVMPPKVILPAGHLCVEGFAVRARGLDGLVPQGKALLLLLHILPHLHSHHVIHDDNPPEMIHDPNI